MPVAYNQSSIIRTRSRSSGRGPGVSGRPLQAAPTPDPRPLFLPFIAQVLFNRLPVTFGLAWFRGGLWLAAHIHAGTGRSGRSGRRSLALKLGWILAHLSISHFSHLS